MVYELKELLLIHFPKWNYFSYIIYLENHKEALLIKVTFYRELLESEAMSLQPATSLSGRARATSLPFSELSWQIHIWEEGAGCFGMEVTGTDYGVRTESGVDELVLGSCHTPRSGLPARSLPERSISFQVTSGAYT